MRSRGADAAAERRRAAAGLGLPGRSLASGALPGAKNPARCAPGRGLHAAALRAGPTRCQGPKVGAGFLRGGWSKRCGGGASAAGRAAPGRGPQAALSAGRVGPLTALRAPAALRSPCRSRLAPRRCARRAGGGSQALVRPPLIPPLATAVGSPPASCGRGARRSGGVSPADGASGGCVSWAPDWAGGGGMQEGRAPAGAPFALS